MDNLHDGENSDHTSYLTSAFCIPFTWREGKENGIFLLESYHLASMEHDLQKAVEATLAYKDRRHYISQIKCG